jgi:hypothetical protein
MDEESEIEMCGVCKKMRVDRTGDLFYEKFKEYFTRDCTCPQQMVPISKLEKCRSTVGAYHVGDQDEEIVKRDD